MITICVNKTLRRPSPPSTLFEAYYFEVVLKHAASSPEKEQAKLVVWWISPGYLLKIIIIKCEGRRLLKFIYTSTFHCHSYFSIFLLYAPNAEIHLPTVMIQTAVLELPPAVSLIFMHLVHIWSFLFLFVICRNSGKDLSLKSAHPDGPSFSG